MDVADGEAQPVAQGPIVDVWSRAQRKYRVRALLLLLFNFLLFCGLCVFTHWLHVGRLFDFRVASYVEPLRFWGPQTQNLYDFVLFPINVTKTPVHAIVIGLLLASIVAVPISVAILYRLLSAVPFLLAVLLFAHLPWMAVTLAVSAVLATVPPFRMKFRYGSALLGMLPVLVYLLLATRGPREPLSAAMSPQDKQLLTGTWLLAVLAACTMMAVIIFIARLVKYRPGAVAPVMTVMFAAPVLLFRSYVGVDELYYRVLEAEYGPRSPRFESVQDAGPRMFELLQNWARMDLEPERARAALLALFNDPGELRALKNRITQRFLVDLMNDRQAAYEACREFIADHPTSRYVPCVLFIQARAMDMRMDERVLAENGRRELYADFPHPGSEPLWTSLLTQYPDSPLAAAARLRVAQLRLRAGDVDGALGVLTTRAVPDGKPVTSEPARPLALLRTQPPEASLNFDPDPDLFEAWRLRELIEANRDDARYGNEPLQALARLDPHRPRYREQLLHLAERFRDGLLHDNLVVRWALAARQREERGALLLACIARFPSGDALPEALFARADLELQLLGSEDVESRAAAVTRLHQIVEQFPTTCWAQRARERLRMLQPESAPTVAIRESP